MQRASESEQTASAGISAVASAFARIKWGVAENSRHDLGTDLFLLARDERLFDLGLVIGAQVKTGSSYFNESLYEASELKGWWFRDDDRAHVDAWASHGLPHLLILHDLDANKSYWVHVTTDAIVPTGQGAKVLVPAEQTVDEEHRESLLAVAATLRSNVKWEGSAWTGNSPLAAPDVLRHALIVPRLVALHPNAGHDVPLSAEQAVALLVQARLGDLDHFAEAQPDVPSLAEAKDSSNWTWRFVGALGDRITTDAIDGLLAAVESAPNPCARSASAVITASAFLVDGRADEAVDLLEKILVRDDASPVDHAWLTGQLARARAEIGRIDEARADAAMVQAVRSRAPHDVTASAIAGSAAILLFNTSGWGKVKVGDVIAGADTAANWWRTQTMSWGLDAAMDRTFKRWARDTTTTIGGADVANNQLYAASLQASHAGDQASWKHLTRLLGQDMLMRLDRHADPQAAHTGLTALRLTGDEKALKLAVRQLVSDGPASAVTLATTDVNLNQSTRTTALSDLTLLQEGGDVLEQPIADRTIEWLLATLRDPTAFVARTTPSYLLDLRLVETLAAVIPAASPSAHNLVMEMLLALPGQEQLLAIAWAKVIRALPDETWNEDATRRLATNTGTHHGELRTSIFGLLARHDDDARRGLIDEARAGSLDALAALGDVTKLSDETAGALTESLARQVRDQVEKAHTGHFGFGGHDIGSALALLNVWHPDVAAWEPLLELLSEPAVLVEHKRGALETLGNLADRIPTDVQAQLRPIAVTAAEQSTAPASMFETERDNMGPGTYLATVLGALGESATADRILNLLAGDRNHRRWATQIARQLGRPDDIGVLATLSQDSDVDVRAAASASLASIVVRQLGGALAANALQRCLDDPGTQVPIHVAAVLAGAPERDANAESALRWLSIHISANARSLASQVRH
jgi:hypothetical protein